MITEEQFLVCAELVQRDGQLHICHHINDRNEVTNAQGIVYGDITGEQVKEFVVRTTLDIPTLIEKKIKLEVVNGVPEDSWIRKLQS